MQRFFPVLILGSENFNEIRSIIADWTRQQVLAAFETNDLVAARRGHAINLSVKANNAGITIAAAGSTSCRLAGHTVVHHNIVSSQTARL